LIGTEIPIGARILAVVDCFDALTSDRPYRARMSDAEALAIITDRRSTMYDPLVVDTFLRIYPDLRSSETFHHAPLPSLLMHPEFTGVAKATSPVTHIQRPQTSETL
jgi:HD-GYP domain-containing protein (c-di-GMP phosphodiesterase class II)